MGQEVTQWWTVKPVPPTTARTWTMAELFGLVEAYGAVTREQQVMAVAVVVGESGRFDGAVGGPTKSGQRSDGTFDVGLWQINGYWFFSWYSALSESYARGFDPIESTKLARRISKEWTDFTAWNATKRTTFPIILEEVGRQWDELHQTEPTAPLRFAVTTTTNLSID